MHGGHDGKGDGFFFFRTAEAAPWHPWAGLPQIAGAPSENLRRHGLGKPTIFFAPGAYTDGCPVGKAWGGGFLEQLVKVAAVSFLVNGLLLLGTARLAGRRLPPPRWLASALLGAAHGAGCLVPGFGFLGGLHWRLVSLGLMGVLAFGPDLKLCCSYAVLTMALGGAASAAGRGGLWQLPLYAAGVFLLGKFAFGPPGKRRLPVEISGGGKHIRLTALVDTGNELRDPITGRSVLVIGAQAARELTGLTPEQLKRPLETITASPLPGLRLIPYRAVGAENGLLLAMRFPSVCLGGRRGPGIVAFAPQVFEEDYQALAGGNV